LEMNWAKTTPWIRGQTTSLPASLAGGSGHNSNQLGDILVLLALLVLDFKVLNSRSCLWTFGGFMDYVNVY
jgi:hypothetical protein